MSPGSRVTPPPGRFSRFWGRCSCTGSSIATAWARRRAALAAYRDTLTASGEIAPNSVLPDLLHLHHVRMAGISPDTERLCGRLARAAALSWTTRTQRAT
ncbi:MAG: lantibiotic dehydratase C-terminal domain-containing protein [Pseudonocardiaceae bacterium]